MTDDPPQVHRSNWVGLCSWGLVLFLLVMMGLGGIVLSMPEATVLGPDMSYPRRVFNVVNAATLTGFETSFSIADFKFPGQVTIFILIVSGAMVSLLVGGWGLVRVLKMPYGDGQIAVWSLIIPFVLIVAGTVTLSIPGAKPWSPHPWATLFQATSAFANSGTIISDAPAIDSLRLHLVLLPLGLLGGLGIPVLLDLIDSIRAGRRLHAHSSTVLASTAAVFVLGFGLICWMEWPDTVKPDRSATDEEKAQIETQRKADVKRAILVASTETLNNRSLGLPTWTFGDLSRSSKWIVLVIMLIGGSPAGTGGGIKTTTLYVFARDIIRLARGDIVGKILGFAGIWLAMYLLAVLVTTILLTIYQPQADGERMLFLAASAVGNVGTTQSPLLYAGTTLYLLSGAMLFGRLAPLAMIWLAVRSLDEAEIPVARVARSSRARSR